MLFEETSSKKIFPAYPHLAWRCSHLVPSSTLEQYPDTPPAFSLIRPRALNAVTEQGLGKSAIHVERVRVNTPNTQTLSVWQSEGIFLHITRSNLICTPAHCWQPFKQASPEQTHAFTGLLGQLPPVSGG